MEMSGDTRVFLLINTTEYNNDGKWGVIKASIEELDGLGLDSEDVKRVDNIDVGDVLTDFDFRGVMVIRVA